MEACLKKYFGYSSLRPYQKEVIQKELDGVDCLVVMATGSGKSICYQLPPLVSGKTAVVISPLLSLMQDQVMSLKQKGIKSDYLASSQKNSAVSKYAQEGYYDVLYMTPEKATSLPRSFWDQLCGNGICLFAVDEAHCISEWGHDFRVEYKKLHQLRSYLVGVPFVALTATATSRVCDDIASSLGLREPHIYVGTFDRPNLFYGVKLCDRSLSSISEIVQDIRTRCTAGESTIVYCTTIKDTEQIHSALSSNGINCGIYHGQMDSKSREQSHRSFIRDEFLVMVATIAFGMGIDKPDIRCVIHYGCPKSLESYYQESGRCGRDGLPSSCWLYYSRSDFNKGDFYCAVSTSAEQRTEIMKSYMAAQNYCLIATCHRKHLLSYFGEEVSSDCGNCDNCTTSKTIRDYGEDTMLLLTCIKECGGKFGLIFPINVIRGSRAKKIIEKNGHKLASYGTGRHHSQNWWKALGTMLKTNGFLEEAVRETYQCIRVSEKGNHFLNDNFYSDSPSLVMTLSQEMIELEDLSTTDVEVVADEPYVPSEYKTLSTEELELYHLLINVRAKLSQDHSVAPYAICGDVVIRSLAKFRPSRVDLLYKIDGINQNFICRYGVVFVHCIKGMSCQLQLPLDNFSSDEFPEYEDDANNSEEDENFNKILETVLYYITISDGISLEDLVDNLLDTNRSIVVRAVQKLEADLQIYKKNGLYMLF